MPLSDLYLFLKFFFHLSSRNNYFTVTYDSVGQGVLKIFQDFWQTSQISNSNWNSFDFQLTLRFFKGPLRHCKERSNLIGFIWYVKFYGKRPNSLLLMLDGIISISSFIAVPKQIGERVWDSSAVYSLTLLCVQKNPLWKYFHPWTLRSWPCWHFLLCGTPLLPGIRFCTYKTPFTPGLGNPHLVTDYLLGFQAAHILGFTDAQSRGIHPNTGKAVISHRFVFF